MRSPFLLRPSAAHKWIHCPGYVHMCARFPELEGSIDTQVRDEGLATHWAAYKLGSGDWVPVGEVAPNGIVLTDELIDGALLFLKELQSWGVPVQQELTLPAPLIHEQCGGTSDGWGYSKSQRLIRIADLKMGYRIVDPFENWQELCYLSSLLTYLQIDGLDEQSIEVEFIIVQPRSYGVPGGPIRRWRTVVSNLRGMFNQLRAAAIAAVSPEPVLHAGQHCMDCQARYACPALQHAGLSVLDTVSQTLPNELSPVELSGALSVIEYASDILDALKSGLQLQAQHVMRNGALVPGYGLEPTAGRLKWHDNVQAEVLAVADICGVNLRKPQELVTPTQAKALLNKEVVDSYASRSAGALKLVRHTEQSVRKIFESN